MSQVQVVPIALNRITYAQWIIKRNHPTQKAKSIPIDNTVSADCSTGGVHN